ncbi:unnamed protein product [Acidocella sp. C78]|uniref:endonuclease/exonuclease/phosphatase family protein n=1 Tax=Acidocella sp. C78 TaxID=1671486 RepID=UPI001BBDD2DC|nr:unnamed protein product [Acidocella sp. C78]
MASSNSRSHDSPDHRDWNINSVRLRRDLLHRLNELATPDIVCLQETKVPDELFPDDLGAALGLPHVLKRGMKGYNGVAILSDIRLNDQRYARLVHEIRLSAPRGTGRRRAGTTCGAQFLCSCRWRRS